MIVLVLYFCGVSLQVTIVTPELTFHTQAELGQDHEHHLVTASPHPVTLLATSNGTQIAVQVGHLEPIRTRMWE